MKSLLKCALIIILFCISQNAFSQSVGINNTGAIPDASAILDIQSNSKGLLIPRMDASQRTGITSVAIGLLVFDTDSKSFWYHNGSVWLELVNSGTPTDLSDVDGDTKIQLEEMADEDVIRFDVAGEEAMVLNTAGELALKGKDPNTPGFFQMLNSDSSQFVRLFSGRTDDPKPFLGWKSGSPMRFIGMNKDYSGFAELMRIEGNGNLGIGNSLPLSKLHVAGGLFMEGDVGAVPIEGPGVRMMWIPEKRALRAGQVENAQWNIDSIGSHSTVAGGLNNTARNFAFVGSGNRNSARGEFSFIGSGSRNQANNFFASVVGGDLNKAQGFLSFVGNGELNTALANYSVVVGGSNNIANGDRSFVGGGKANITSGEKSAIAGGDSNNASGNLSGIASGTGNTISGENSFIGAGISNIVSGEKSAIAGGDSNNASGNLSVIAGGTGNTISGENSFIGAGISNIVSGEKSAIAGGDSNNTSGNLSVIASGTGNTISGENSFIGAGISNIASGDSTFIGSGFSNEATSEASAVVSGKNNKANGILSFVGGGNGNEAINDATTISGGRANIASGKVSTISGGFLNKAEGDFSSVSGGLANTASGTNSFIGGGASLVSKSLSEAVFGQYNFSNSQGSNSYSSSDRIFTIGNGTSTSQRSNALVVLKNGNVGIGISSPSKAKLEVNGTTGDNDFTGAWYPLTGTPLPNPIGFFDITLSAYFNDDIAAKSFYAFSDVRIKKNIKISNMENDLKTIMKIEIADYNLKDSIRQGNKKFKKVIAQQVASVYPQAVSSNLTDIVPDIYQRAEVKGGWISLDTDLQVGEKVKLVMDQNESVYEVIEVGLLGFRVKNLPFNTKNVFVYGREVDDFHSVDYEAISMLNVSATQAQQHMILELSKKNEAQEKLIELLLLRMEALENNQVLEATNIHHAKTN